MSFASYQDEIYQRGVHGENPVLPVTFTGLAVDGYPSRNDLTPEALREVR